MYDFGSRLQALRKKRSLTQKQLADKINKSVPAISGYESNMQLPPTDVMTSIAAALNVTLDYLIGDSEEIVYTTGDYNEEQKELLELLFAELSNPTNTGHELSTQQIKIIQKLVLIFSSQ